MCCYVFADELLSSQLQINPAFWVAFTQEEMINSLNVDENVMSEIDSMLSAVTSAPQ